MPNAIAKIALLAALGGSATLAAADDPVDRFHRSLVTLDTHLDTPAVVARAGFDITRRHSWLQDFAQVDLPRMREGGLDGGFWSIFTPVGPLDDAGIANAQAHGLARLALIRGMVARHPDLFALAVRAADAAEIERQGKRIVYISIENATSIGRSAAGLDRYHAGGVRMIGFTHRLNNHFADSSTDPAGPRWGGLSPEGRALVARANDLGVLIDGSHSSDVALDQMIALSAAPVILSHTGCKAVFDHPRNIDDARLRALAVKGGVIQINALGAYMRALPPDPPEKQAALQASYRIDSSTPEGHARWLAARRAIEARWPEARAPFQDVIDHILHAVRVAGVDHVGIGFDWDGGGGVEGMIDVAALPKITAALRRAGLSDADIAKIWGGNTLRALAEAERVARIRKEQRS